MRPISGPSAWLVLLGSSPALAAFEEFWFAGNGGNASAARLCGDMQYDCPPPFMCSLDTLTQKHYCCEPGNSVGACYNEDTACGAGTGKPSGQQIGCSLGEHQYCCLDSEDCTKVANEYNVCWSKQENNLRYLNKTRLNETFSSLSSAQPTAMSFTVNTNDLYLLTSTYPSTASTSPTASTSTNPNSSNNSGLSGGAIGGIVGGVVGGVALLGALAFFLWRRRYNANKKVNSHTSPVDPYQKYGYQPGLQPPMVETHEAPPYSAQQGVPVTVGSADKYAHVGQPPVAEVPGYQNPVEMDGGYQDQAHQANQVK